jgi:deoxyribonuclease V
MKITPLHNWNLTPAEAVQLQKQLAHEIIKEDQFDKPVETVAGIDLGYDAKNNNSRAVVVVLRFPELELLETSEAITPIQFPYVPGLLSFRETPVAIKALEKLTITPDLILCDGQGLAHPRRFGIACHIGLITNVPTLGVAKSLLVGKFENLGETRGSTAPLIHKNEQIGVALRRKIKFNRFSSPSVIASAWIPPSNTFCNARRNIVCRKRRGSPTKWLLIGKSDF